MNINDNDMNKAKGVFVIVLVFAVTLPCFGCSEAIKRKKNRRLYAAEWAKTRDADRDNQIKTDPVGY
jgi:hypothetical protein